MRALLLTILFVASCALPGQPLPPVLTHTPKLYEAGSQNWGITQDDRGYIYSANNDGLLEYDGARWTLYASPNESILRSVKAVGNRIYSGSYMDFGYWERDERGSLQYASLVDSSARAVLPDEQFWGISVVDEQIAFQSLNQFFLYDPASGETIVVGSALGVTKAFYVGGEIYFTDGEHQLFKLVAGAISEPLLRRPDGIPLVQLWVDGERLFAQSAKMGTLELLDGAWSTTSRFSFLEGLRLYSARRLRRGGMAFGTISDGVYIADASGRLRYHIDQTDGLANNTVLSVFEDRQNNLWLGTDNGISCVNLDSPVREYTDDTGRLGTVYASIKYEGYVYLGTNQGLFRQRADLLESPELVVGTEAQVWSLSVHQEVLFVGHDRGTFTLTGSGPAELITGEAGTWQVHAVPDRPDLLLQGTYRGLQVLERTADGWQLRNRVTGFDYSARFLALHDRVAYVSHEYRGVYGIALSDDLRSVRELKFFEEPAKGKNAGLAAFQGSVYYYSRDGVYELRDLNAGFALSEELSAAFAEDDYSSGKVTPDAERLWFFNNKSISYLHEGIASTELRRRTIPIPAALIDSKPGFENVTDIGGDTLLIGNTGGYLLLALGAIPLHQHQLYLSSVRALPVGEEVSHLNLGQVQNRDVELSHTEHNLEFRIAVPYYDKYFRAKYQHRLVGAGDTWSDWTEEPVVGLTELPAGDYRFEARSLLGRRTSENTLSYEFAVNPPWFASWPLLCIYVCAFLLLLYALQMANRRKYERREAALTAENERLIAGQKREAELELTRLNNQRLREDVDNKSREMANSTMNLVKKNELLQKIKTELKADRPVDRNVAAVLKTIDDNTDEAETWGVFRDAFENADQEFFKKIKAIHPQLTPNDLKLCAYLRLNLSSKEIAPLLNISPRSVEVKRYRLRKKMGLEREVGLADYIISI